MSKFSVEVEYTCKFKKTLSMFGKDEEDAEEKAHDLVSSWNNVDYVEILSVEEE